MISRILATVAIDVEVVCSMAENSMLDERLNRLASTPVCRRGYSLAELLLVIGLLTTLSTLVLPGLRSMMHGFNEKKNRNAVIRFLVRTRLTAIEKGRPWLIESGTSRQLVSRMLTPRTDPASTEMNVETLQLPEGYSVSLTRSRGTPQNSTGSASQRIVFQPDGTASGPAIVLWHGTSHQVTVFADASSGMIRSERARGVLP